jgi:hypothetical protein
LTELSVGEGKAKLQVGRGGEGKAKIKVGMGAHRETERVEDARAPRHLLHHFSVVSLIEKET